MNNTLDPPYHQIDYEEMKYLGFEVHIDYLKIFDSEGFYDACEVLNIECNEYLTPQERETLTSLFIKKIYRRYNKMED